MREAIAKINREIRALAVPNVISNVSVPLISSVDTYLMGQLSAASLAAVGLGGMVFNFLYWNMGFLRMGTTGMTAQAYGRGDKANMTAVLLKASFLALVISLIFIVLQQPLFDMACWAMSIERGQLPEVWSYYAVRIFGAPAALLLMAMLGWLFGMQNAKYPLWITVFINIINIAASVYLVRILNMGVRGAALGTLTAQYAGVLFCAAMIYLRYGDQFVREAFTIKHIFDRIGNLLRINQDIFIRTLFLSTAFLLIFRFSREIGPDILAVNVVFMQFLNWMSYAIDGFAYAAESLVGKYKGAKDELLLKLSVRWNMIWGFVFALLFALVYSFYSEDIFGLFIESDDGSLVNLASEYFFWLTLMPILGFACYIWDGIFIGLTASISMRNSMFLAFIVYLLTYLFLPETWGNHRIWAAFSVFLVFRAVFQWFLYWKQGWENIR